MGSRSSLEKQNKDIKQRLDDLEEATKGKSKAAIANMEAKQREPEAELDDCDKTINDLRKANKKLDRKLKEAQGTSEEGAANVESARAEAQKASSKVKSLKRQLEEAEEEAQRHNKAKRKVQAELDEMTDKAEGLEREVSSLKARARRTGATRSTGGRRKAVADEDEDEE